METYNGNITLVDTCDDGVPLCTRIKEIVFDCITNMDGFYDIEFTIDDIDEINVVGQEVVITTYDKDCEDD